MSKLHNLILAGALATAAVAGSAQATELLQNGSFEGPVIGGGSYVYPGQNIASGTANLAASTQDFWTYIGSALVGATGSNPWYGGAAPAGQDGAQFASLQGTSTISQTFTMLGSILNVSWLAGGRPFNGGDNGDQTYKITVGALSSGDFSTTSGQVFAAQGAHFTGLTSGQQYTLSFVGLDSFPGRNTNDETAFIDRVSATGAVPEASTWALMLVGFGGLGGMLRLQRRQRGPLAA